MESFLVNFGGLAVGILGAYLLLSGHQVCESFGKADYAALGLIAFGFYIMQHGKVTDLVNKAAARIPRLTKGA